MAAEHEQQPRIRIRLRETARRDRAGMFAAAAERQWQAAWDATDSATTIQDLQLAQRDAAAGALESQLQDAQLERLAALRGVAQLRRLVQQDAQGGEVSEGMRQLLLGSSGGRAVASVGAAAAAGGGATAAAAAGAGAAAADGGGGEVAAVGWASLPDAQARLSEAHRQLLRQIAEEARNEGEEWDRGRV